MRLVTVFRTFNAAEAQLIRSRLDAAEFQAHVTGELSSFSVEGYSLATGGIRVQVPEDEADEARAFLDALQNEEE